MCFYIMNRYEQVQGSSPWFLSIVSSHTSSHNVRPGRWPRSTFRLSLCLSLLHFFILKLCDSCFLGLSFIMFLTIFASICCILFARRIMETLALGRCSLLQRLKTKGAHANSGLVAKSWTVTMTMLHDLILIHKGFTRCKYKVASFR